MRATARLLWARKFFSVTASAGEERMAVPPVGDLAVRDDRARGQDRAGRGGENGRRQPEPRRQVAGPPGEGDEGADQGDVGVAVRHGRVPQLDEADHGQERHEVPGPAEGQVWKSAAPPERHGRHGGQEEGGGQDGRGRPGLQGVEHGKPRRPDRLPQVQDAGHERISDPFREGQLRERDHGPALLLRHDRDHAEDDRKDRQGDLFRQQRQKRERAPAGLVLRRRLSPLRLPLAVFLFPWLRVAGYLRGGRLPGGVEPLQRPPVHQQQDDGHGDEHRFGHQARQEENKNGKVALRSRPLRVKRVGPQGEHPEEGAEHVLALGDPGDGLHVQGVQGEQGGGEGASPPGLRHTLQGEEEQDRVERVKEHVDEMVGAGTGSEQPAVEHVREPRQRVPVPQGRRCEGPLHAVRRQAALHDEIFLDVERVVVIDVVEGPDLRVEGRRQHRESDRGEGVHEDPALLSHEGRAFRGSAPPRGDPLSRIGRPVPSRVFSRLTPALRGTPSPVPPRPGTGLASRRPG